MDHAKFLDVLTSLPLSQSILPCAVCFATSRPANHAICRFIDSSGYASGPIRRCLFIDYIIMSNNLKLGQKSIELFLRPFFLKTDAVGRVFTFYSGKKQMWEYCFSKF